MSINTTDIIIEKVFGNTKYYIDFYQRDYKWKKEHIIHLLDDIFYKFENEYKEDKDISTDSISKYGWYYLHTFVVNDYKGKIFIVDGQQRFTTLTLILIKLYHLSAKHKLEKRAEWIKSKIYGIGAEGPSYWMGQNDRTPALEDLFTNGVEQSLMSQVDNNISIKNIYQNYIYINEYLDNKLSTAHKLEAFLLYFLTRIFLVEIKITDSKDVSMVFEVINDRGEKLKPYEVFKGELLGQLDKDEIDQYYAIWTNNISKLQQFEEQEIDNFFRLFFRSKFVDTRNDYREFDGEYHKTVFSNKWNDIFKLKRNAKEVKRFIKEDFDYYSKLYVRLLQETTDEDSFLFLNALNEQDRQYLLIFSAIEKNDPDEDEKIALVAKLFDKLYSLLQIMGCYDSNNFTESITALNTNLRNKSSNDIKAIFEKQLIGDINSFKNISVSDPFQWGLFKEANNNLGLRFIRYFYSRIDHFIAKNAKTTTDTYHNLVRNTGPVNGYHVEHILADNGENKAIFGNDEDLFYRERNKLGALLLLKGRDNISSSNEKYADKLKTYSHGTLFAKTLTKGFYHKNPDFDDLNTKYSFNFRAIDSFDQNAVDERQKLLFDMVKVIWSS